MLTRFAWWDVFTQWVSDLHNYLFKSINKINSAMLIQHGVSCPPFILIVSKDVARWTCPCLVIIDDHAHIFSINYLISSSPSSQWEINWLCQILDWIYSLRKHQLIAKTTHLINSILFFSSCECLSSFDKLRRRRDDTRPSPTNNDMLLALREFREIKQWISSERENFPLVLPLREIFQLTQQEEKQLIQRIIMIFHDVCH